MRISRTTRLAATAVAGVLALLAPNAAVAAAQPTTDQPPPSGQQTSAQPPTSAPSGAPPPRDDTFAKPPPLPPNFPLPAGDGKPDLPYEQKEQCVSSLDNGVVLPNEPWGQDLLRFDELHKFATGKNQTVAVIDTGVNPHDFLAGRLDGGGDYVIETERGLKDCDGHGTEVAGIIAANPRNPGIGFKGIAPDAKIISIRQSSANYQGKDPQTGSDRGAGNLNTLADAIVRAANQVPGGVINMSVDNCRPASPITEAEQKVQAALRYAVEVKDVVPVSSAGNLNEDKGCSQQNGPDANRPTTLVTPPWFSDYVLSVAAMGRSGDPAEFSVQGPWVSVAAPGTDIISLDPGNPKGLANQIITKDRKQIGIQGTSFASPYVAGLAALIRDRFADRKLTAKQVMHRIKATASHPAATGGRDNLVGYGMINPIAALTANIPSEQGIPPDEPINIKFDLPTPVERDWTPVRVAVIGTIGGVGLLLITLFVVHTVRRRRGSEMR